MSAYAAAIRKEQVDALLEWLAAGDGDMAEGAHLARDGLEEELRTDGVPLDDHHAVVRGAFRALLDADVLPVGARPDVETLLHGPAPASSLPLADYAAGVSKAQVDALLAWLAGGAGDLAEGARIASGGFEEAALQHAGVSLGDGPAVVRYAFEALREADVFPIAARGEVDRLIAELRRIGPGPQQAATPPSPPPYSPLQAPAPPSHDAVAPVLKQVDVVRSGRLPWWRHIGTEQPRASERCERTGCTSHLSPVDLCCPTQGHDDILPGQGWPERLRFWVVNSARTAAAILVLASAARETTWPIYGLAVALGCVVVGLFLHAHRAARFIAVGGLGGIMAAVGAVVALGVADDQPHVVGTAIVGLPLVVGALLVVATMRFETKDLTEAIERESMCAIVTSLVLALLAGLSWWAATGPLARWFVEVSPSRSTWALLWGMGAAGATLAAAVVGALLLSRGEIKDHVVPLVGRLPQAWTVPWTYDVPDLIPPVNTSVGASLAWHVSRAGHKLTKAVVDVARQTLQQLLRAEAAIRRVICRAINRVHRRLVLIGRRVSFVAQRGRAIYAAALSQGARATAYMARPIGAYAAAVGASVAALHLAAAYTDYLLSGSLHALASGAGWTLLGLALCVVIVERLASTSSHDLSRAARRFAYVGGVDVSMVVVVSGLALGLPGTFGPGPIHVGWVTISGIVLWASLMAFARTTRRRT